MKMVEILRMEVSPLLGTIACLVTLLVSCSSVL